VPDIAALPDDAQGRAIRHGRALVEHTTALIGPDAKDPAMRYAGSGLECSNCHLDAGTARFGLPLVGIWRQYPTFGARVNRTVTIDDRINDCMLRSVNGRELPAGSPELQAIAAYIRFLSSDWAGPSAPTGRGAPRLTLPAQSADPTHGKAVYTQFCAACHQADGAGVRLTPEDAAARQQRYLFPPLWGPDSFNDGAGMARVITAAWFVHANMPRGITFEYPLISAHDAYDVAGYIAEQKRPHFAGLDRDYPDLWLKPADSPHPPLLGPFSARQRLLGPWPPIEAWVRAHRPTTETNADSAGNLETVAAGIAPPAR
jgi:thiosulfate dehydrogenase